MKKRYLAIGLVLALGTVSCGGDDAAEKVTETVETTIEKTEEVVEEIIEEATTKYTAGEEIYGKTCKACHQAAGTGIPGAFPPLAESDYLLEDKIRAIKQVINGSSEEMVVNGVTYNGTMTPQNLEDQEIVDVLNYVLNSWGNEGGEITLEDVAEAKK